MILIANLELFVGMLLVAVLGLRWANKKINQTTAELRNTSERSEQTKD